MILKNNKNFTFIAVTILLATSFVINAQDFKGRAVYEYKATYDDMPNKETETAEEFEKQRISNGVKELMEKQRTFILDFNKIESIYKEDESLNQSVKLANGMVMKMASSGLGKKYKNIKTKSQISEEEILTKMFLVEENLPTWNWVLLNETKKIGDYFCMKARAIIPVSEDKKKAYEAKRKEEENNKTNFLKSNEPKESVVNVWYSPEISVSHGPEEYWGLPGLILEVNDGESVILCSKIILNSRDVVEIKQPKKGVKISREKFIEVEKEKMQEIKERYKKG